MVADDVVQRALERRTRLARGAVVVRVVVRGGRGRGGGRGVAAVAGTAPPASRTAAARSGSLQRRAARPEGSAEGMGSPFHGGGTRERWGRSTRVDECGKGRVAQHRSLACERDTSIRCRCHGRAQLAGFLRVARGLEGPCGCVGAWVRGCVGGRVRRVRGCTGARVYGCAGVWVWLRGRAGSGTRATGGGPPAGAQGCRGAGAWMFRCAGGRPGGPVGRGAVGAYGGGSVAQVTSPGLEPGVGSRS